MYLSPPRPHTLWSSNNQEIIELLFDKLHTVFHLSDIAWVIDKDVMKQGERAQKHTCTADAHNVVQYVNELIDRIWQQSDDVHGRCDRFLRSNGFLFPASLRISV